MKSVDGGTAVTPTTVESLDPRSPQQLASSMRASDAERAAVVDRLHAALGEGRLDLAETEERTAAAYACRFRSELVDLLVDLPAPEPSGLRAGWAQVWNAIVRQTWISSARARGTAPADPSAGQQRATSIVLISAVFWIILCLLVGLVVGALG
ncbi:MAG: DUF1707 domain-containing protein [Pseudonocardia sp.]|nr:DUF1707 domain-containing protein [Pseudonocardia sp.]